MLAKLVLIGAVAAWLFRKRGEARAAAWVLDLGSGAEASAAVADGSLPLEVEAFGRGGVGRYVLVAWSVGKPGEARRAYYELTGGVRHGSGTLRGVSWYGSSAA